MNGKQKDYKKIIAGMIGLIFIGVISILLIYYLPGLKSVETTGTPKLSLQENTHDFGKISEDQSVSHTFTIHNTGNGTLNITKVEPDCDCTVPTYDKSIPPGGRGKINLGLKPFSVVNEFKKSTIIHTNDPEHPEVVLILRGVAEPMVAVNPSHIVRLKGTPGQDTLAQVRITSRLPTPWQVKYFQTSIPDKIDISLKTEEPGKVYVMEIKNKFKEKGAYSGIVEIFNNFEKHPRLLLRVFGNFQG